MSPTDSSPGAVDDDSAHEGCPQEAPFPLGSLPHDLHDPFLQQAFLQLVQVEAVQMQWVPWGCKQLWHLQVSCIRYLAGPA